MTALARNSMRNATLVVVPLLLVLTMPTLAGEDSVKVPFLFTEDEKLAQTDLGEVIPLPPLTAPLESIRSESDYLDTMIIKGLGSIVSTSVWYQYRRPPAPELQRQVPAQKRRFPD